MRTLHIPALVAVAVVGAGPNSGWSALLSPPLSASSKPPGQVSQSAQTVGQYEKLELTVRLPSTYANPFDPDEVHVQGTFTTPSGRIIKIPGFYYQGYQRSRDGDGNESLTPIGSGVFKIRFASGEIGSHRFSVSVRDGSGPSMLGTGSFTVRPSPDQGYLQRCYETRLYFRFDSGASYFPIGENICWPQAGGTYDYDLWLAKLAQHGGNYFRIWMANDWNPLGLERVSRSPDDGCGLGRYDQAAAWRIDHILDLAHQLDLRALITIESFNTVDAAGPYKGWKESPYNAANDGPCARPFAFFVSPEATRLFKRRLRYLAARWGYSTSVFAWELCNEVDQASGYRSAPVADWHREMAVYLRASDPWCHPITTSFGGTAGDKAIDKLTMIDFVQSHSYGARDIAGVVADVTRDKIEAYRKPHYVGEFGIHCLSDENATDPEGLYLHNGLWASMVSGSAGTAMVWWWDSYIEPQNLYHHFAHVAAFAAGIDWVKENYRPVEAVDLCYLPGQEPKAHLPVVISPVREEWEEHRCNQPQTFQVMGDGKVSNFKLMSRVLHGTGNHPSWHNPATLLVDYPGPGRFEVMVGGVSGHGGAGLTISLDGRKVLLADFPDGEPDHHDDMHQYDDFYGIDVLAGQHTIVVDNPGQDWCYVSYRLTNYLQTPNLRVLAVANDRSALVWAQNREHTWWHHKQGLLPTPVGASQITFGDFEPGHYEVQQWDTNAGTISQTSQYSCADGKLVLTTPPGLTTDVAYKIRKMRESTRVRQGSAGSAMRSQRPESAGRRHHEPSPYHQVANRAEVELR